MSFDLRPAQPTDAGQIGEILHRFETDTPWMPKEHSGAEAIAFCGVMIDRGWVIIAAHGRQILGFLARDGEEICALYVAPHARNQGIGAALLTQAKAQVSQITLWTFQANIDAQRFYLGHDFVEVGRTDGLGNAENLPDIAYVWNKVMPDYNDTSMQSDGPRKVKECGA